MAATDRTLTDVLLLLTKVSSQLGGKITSLEKMVSLKRPKESTNSKVDEIQEKKLTNIENLLSSQIKEREPEKVVEEGAPVVITEFGKDAENFLAKIIGLNAPKELKPVKEDKKKEDGLISKLIEFLPTIGLIAAGLGGLLSSVFKGDFKKTFDLIKEGKFFEALKSVGNIIYKTIEPYIQSIPVIGPIYSFAQAYLEIEKGNVVSGLKYIGQAVVGLLPFPIPVKAAMIGGVAAISAIVENRYPEIKIPEGKGGDVLPIALKAIGKIVKIGVLKRLPILGSAINFYEAYTAFEAGGPAGIAKGLINLGSGIANLIPGYGTMVSIGLDILSAMIFSEEEKKDDAGKTVKKIKLSDFFLKVYEFLKKTPIIGSLLYIGEGIYDFANGNIKEGLVNLAKAIPAVGYVTSLYEVQKETTSNVVSSFKLSTGIKSFYKILQRSMTISFIKMFPELFGMRAKVAEYFGIPLSEVGSDSSQTIPESPSKLNMNAYSDLDKNNRQKSTTPLPPETTPTLPDTPVNVNEKVEEILGQQTKISDENNKILNNLTKAQSSLLFKQLEVMNKHTSLLIEIKENLLKPVNTVVSNPTIIKNNYSQGVSLRQIQGVTA